VGIVQSPVQHRTVEASPTTSSEVVTETTIIEQMFLFLSSTIAEVLDHQFNFSAMKIAPPPILAKGAEPTLLYA
jgi:hypothetical protein